MNEATTTPQRTRFAGRYVLLKPLGQGAMGEVFLALDLRSESECALKRLRQRPDTDVATVRKEFENLSRVRHPAVVSVLDFGVAADGTPFYTMEYVPGRPADLALPPGSGAPLFRVAAETAQALEALHAAGIVHGDLKPGNLLVVADANGEPAAVKLVDFGLASIIGNEEGGHRGTPGYAAPEVVTGSSPDVGADLYALGATLYRLVSGRAAFGESGVAAVLDRQRREAPSAAPLESAGAPDGLVRLILRLMAMEPRERPGSAREVRRELESLSPAARRPLEQRLAVSVVVGRERELSQLTARLARRKGGIVYLTGVSGIGKSAVLGELATRLALADRPLLRLQGGALTQPGAGARALMTSLLAEAGTSAEEFGDLARSTRAFLMSGQASVSEAEVARIVEAAVSLLPKITRRGAPVVLVDDADRLDPVSRWFVRRLALHPRARRATWVLAQQGLSEHPGDDDRVLVDTALADHIELEPLDAEGIARLAAARLREEARAHLVQYLWTRGRGHPGFTVELMQLAVARGAVREEAGGLIADPEALNALGIPDTFDDSRFARMSELPAGARRAAIALAVAESALSLETLQRIDETIDREAVSELLESGFARSDADGASTLASPALGERLLAGLDEGERSEAFRASLRREGLPAEEEFRLLRGTGDHAAALAAAERAFTDTRSAAVAESAAALASTAAPEQAGAWHERAGRVLVERGRHGAALPHLRAAVKLAREPEVEAERLALLSTALIRTGGLDELEGTVSRGLEIAPTPALRSRLLIGEAARWHQRGDFTRARAPMESSLTLARESGEPGLIAIAAQSLAYTLLDLDALEDAGRTATLALETFSSCADVVGMARATSALGAISRARGEHESAVRLYREALDRGRAADARQVMEEALHGLTAALAESGEWDAMRTANREALRIASEDGRPRGVAVAMANLAVTEGLTGRSRSAKRHAMMAIELTRRHIPRMTPAAHRALAMAHRGTGRIQAAEQAALQALDLSMRMGVGYETEWSRLAYAQALGARQAWGEVETALGTVLQSKPGPRLVGLCIMGVLYGRAALRLGRVDDARHHLVRADEWLKSHKAPYAAAFAKLLRSELLIHEEEESAAGVADRALGAFADLPAPCDRAEAALDLGEWALDRGPSLIEPAIRWLEAAASAFDRLGNRRGRERALSRLVEALRRRPAGAAPGSGDRDLLGAVSQLLQSLTDVHELCTRAMQMLVRQLDAERGVLLLVNEESGRLEPQIELGGLDADSRRDAVSFSRRVVRQVVESGGSLLIGDAAAEPGTLSESMVDLRLRSIVCVPLFVGGRVTGAVYLDDSRRASAFSEHDRGLLEGFAQLVAVAIDKSRGHAETQRTNEQLMGENISLRQQATHQFQAHRLIGTSRAMQRVLAVVDRTAMTSSSVLLTGENGTGKELIARILHHSGKRKHRPFIAVNCGAIPEALLESELFGILPNVATGVAGRIGRFQQADGGTLFLDEVGDMPLNQQVALLSALANREITPVGGGKPIPVDVRLIAATNRDLRGMVERAEFREDLFYRLNVIPLEVPPLRDRKADIPALAQYFAAQFAGQQEREIPELSPQFLAALMQSDWPGNVRELQNYIERVMAMNPGPVLYPSPLPRDLEERGDTVQVGRGRGLNEMVAQLERRLVQEALSRAGGNQSLAARELGIPEQKIRYRMRKYGILSPREKRRTRQKRR